MDKTKYIFYNDIVEANGKTIAENNAELTHLIPIGTLVELENGERLYISNHERDVDQTPLYRLSLFEDIEEEYYRYSTSGYHFDSLKIITLPQEKTDSD